MDTEKPQISQEELDQLLSTQETPPSNIKPIQKEELKTPPVPKSEKMLSQEEIDKLLGNI